MRFCIRAFDRSAQRQRNSLGLYLLPRAVAILIQPRHVQALSLRGIIPVPQPYRILLIRVAFKFRALLGFIGPPCNDKLRRDAGDKLAK